MTGFKEKESQHGFRVWGKNTWVVTVTASGWFVQLWTSVSAGNNCSTKLGKKPRNLQLSSLKPQEVHFLRTWKSIRNLVGPLLKPEARSAFIIPCQTQGQRSLGCPGLADGPVPSAGAPHWNQTRWLLRQVKRQAGFAQEGGTKNSASS